MTRKDFEILTDKLADELEERGAFDYIKLATECAGQKPLQPPQGGFLFQVMPTPIFAPIVVLVPPQSLLAEGDDSDYLDGGARVVCVRVQA